MMALSLAACGGSSTTTTTATDTTTTTTTVDAAQAIALTAGIDAGASFTGGSGADTFTANKADGTNHFTSLDALDGGAGVDTMVGSFTASFDSATAISATVANIELVTFTTTDDMTVNTSTWTGVTDLTLTSVNAMVATAAATTNIVAATGNLDTASTIDGGKAVTFTSAEAVTLAAAATSSAITIGGTTAAKGAVTVTHTETYTDDTVAGADVAAGSTITVTGGTTVTVNSLASLGVQASAHDDTATTGAVSVTGTADTTSVTVTQSDAVNTAATAALSIDHAAGAVTIADASAASATAAGTITEVTLNNYGASTIDSGALTTVSISGTGGTLGITAGALTTATVDTLTLNTDTSTAGAVTVDADYTTLNINNSTAASTIANVTATGATTVNFTGAAAVTLTDNTFAAATDFNVTGAGGVTLGTTAIAVGTDFDGNDGADSVILGATTQGITMGAGDDTVTYGGAAGTGGSVAAGSGTADKIIMTAAQAAAADANTTFNTTFTGFEVLQISDALAANSLDTDLLNNVNHVILAADTAGDSTLSNMDDGAQIDIKAARATDTLSVGLTGANTGTNDTLNVAIINAAGIDAGIISAASVETINIVAADATAAGGTAVGHTIDLDAATGYKTVNVSGNNGLAMTADSTAITSFDASGVVANGTADTAALLAVTNTFGALAGASTIAGGEGNDTLNAAAAVAAVTLTGNAGADILTGSATIASTIDGGAGGDTITGGAAADTITGGAGTDTFVFSSAALAEQTGTSTTTGVVINLGATELTDSAVNTAMGSDFLAGNQSGVASGTATYLFNSESNTNAAIVDTLTTIENVTGTNGDDYLVGSATANTIDAGAGTDYITTGAGADVVVYDAATEGGSATTVTSLTATTDDYTVTLAGTTDYISDFTSGTDKINISGALQTALNAVGTIDDTAIALADNGVMDFNAGTVFIFNTVDDLAGDDFGDISALYDATATTNSGTHTNVGTGNQNVIIAVGNNTGDQYGVYYIDKDDDTSEIELGDVISLLAVVETSVLVAADFSFG